MFRRVARCYNKMLFIILNVQVVALLYSNRAEEAHEESCKPREQKRR